MKILITGRLGQLSQELQTALADQGQIMALGSRELNLAEVEDISRQVRNIRPDLIINTAAYTAVDKAETNHQAAFAINAVAAGRLAEEAARLRVPLIHYSTDYVFNGRKNMPYTEQDKADPLSVYGQSKLEGEQAIQAIAGQHLILRTSWVYSRYGKNFLLTMLRLLQEREQLSVVCDEIGTPTWTNTIASVTRQLIKQWRTGQQTLNGLYHLTATGETSWYGFASAIGQYLKTQGYPCAHLEPILAKDYPTAATRPRNSRLDCSALQAHWNIQLPTWDNALHNCLAQVKLANT